MANPSRSDNVRLTERMFERWNSGHHEVDPEFVDPELELHSPISSAHLAPYRGYDGVRERVAEVDGQFEAWRIQLVEANELEDGRVLASGIIRLRARGSDVELEQPVEWLLAFRNGRLLRYEAFVDQDADPAGIAPSDR